MLVVTLAAATCLLGAAAFAGLIMALLRSPGPSRSYLSFALGQGLVACAGLTLLLYAALMTDSAGRGHVAAVLFVGAAIGGNVTNLLFGSKGLPLPKPLVIGHSLVTAVAVSMLWS